MIGTDISTTPSCTGVVVVRGTALPTGWAPVQGAVAGGTARFGATGLPIGTAVRLRVGAAAEGFPVAMTEPAHDATGGTAAVQLNSDTPGDLPPGDPPG
ncbi:hypothetical protein [Klenkia sp. PcliD-1-E]|uniref:hypothetical protein n=1 Tax=Klenkia sp. PcliD-1-E TaxID=2954492 RepID=UPI002096AB05|nr:hypothetical protein [Klenkia sp. PcliD-1-E]MCO7222381.1 hypothetical protein [Klenkia sp. PcliD-1-E]